jgi:hypothetical protein
LSKSAYTMPCKVETQHTENSQQGQNERSLKPRAYQSRNAQGIPGKDEVENPGGPR